MQRWMLFFCIVLPSVGFAQSMVLDPLSLHNVFVIIDNNIRFEPKNCTCAEVTVASDYGQVSPVYAYKGKCAFRYAQPSIGQGFVRMRFTVQGQVHDTVFTLLAQPWPKHRAFVGYSQEGFMKRGEFLAQRGVHVPMAFGDIDGNILVLSYTVDIIYASAGRMDRFENRGGAFEKQLHEKFEQLKSGDRVSFSNIKVKMPGESTPTTLDDIFIAIL